VKNAVSDFDKAINKLRVKHKTYIVEYDVDSVSMLSFSKRLNYTFGPLSFPKL